MNRFLDKLSKALEESMENALSTHRRAKFHPPNRAPELDESGQSTKGSSQVSRAPAFGSTTDDRIKKKNRKKTSNNSEVDDSDNT